MLRTSHHVIRPLLRCELPHAYTWAVNEGWNPGACDAAIFLAGDPGSLLTIEIKGRPAGVVSAVRISPHFGLVGFFVIPPEQRRSVYGWALLNAALERLEHRTIGGDAVSNRIHNYAHLGFQPSFQTVSHHGIAPLQPAPWQTGVELAARASVNELIAYDSVSFGVSRAPFLREWLQMPGSRSLVFRHNGRIRGLGTARRCHSGVRIGPLQADCAEIAEMLFDALIGLAPGEPVSIDCPNNNPESARLACKKGFQVGSTTTRMYRGEPPAGRPGQVYGLMSFALG